MLGRGMYLYEDRDIMTRIEHLRIVPLEIVTFTKSNIKVSIMISHDYRSKRQQF